jgi:signal transduction histidine kinase
MTGRDIEVELDLGYDGTAHFDEQKILRVFHNLARNAAEAMPDGGHLRLGCVVEGDDLVLSITDDGPGIPEEIQGRLFELFASGRRGGTGLGLAIVRKIVDDHRGTIAWTTGPRGTSFHIRLPLDRPDAAEVAA